MKGSWKRHIRSWLTSRILLEYSAGVVVWIALVELVFKGFNIESFLLEFPVLLVGLLGWFYHKAVRPIHDFKYLRPPLKDPSDPHLNQKRNELEQLMDDQDFLRGEVEKYRHQLNAKFEEAKQEYLELAKKIMVREVSGSVVHDLRNPLAVIFSYTDFLKEALLAEKIDTATAHKCIDKITFSSHWINRLIDRMSKFDAFEFHSMTSVSLSQAISNVWQLLERRAQGVDLEFKMQLPKDLPEVRGDLGGIEQVFLNLISNAIDALAANRKGQIHISAQVDDENVFIHLADNGIGIPDENIENLFKPFFTTKEEGKGTGLGLAIARQIVARHSGDLSVKSKLGEGTVFTVRLPRAHGVKKKVAPPAAA